MVTGREPSWGSSRSAVAKMQMLGLQFEQQSFNHTVVVSTSRVYAASQSTSQQVVICVVVVRQERLGAPRAVLGSTDPRGRKAPRTCSSAWSANSPSRVSLHDRYSRASEEMRTVLTVNAFASFELGSTETKVLIPSRFGAVLAEAPRKTSLLTEIFSGDSLMQSKRG